MANDFNKGMANVASLGDEAASHIWLWKPMIQDLAIEMGKGTTDMAEGLYQVVSAFGAGKDSMNILEINARTAAAGLSTVSEAIGLTSAVTKAYGDTSKKAVGQVADLAMKTVQLGQTTFPELAGSIGLVAPLASNLGVSMEELFGVMATGSGVTGSAGEVATQFRGILQSLMAPTQGVKDLLKEMGYESGTAMLAGEGLQGTISAIVGAADASGKPLQNYIGSIEGQTLALALAGPQAATFTEKILAMSQAAGTTQEAFLAQTQGVNKAGFALEQLKTRAMVTGQRIGDGLAPALLTLLDRIDPLIQKVEGLALKFSYLDPKTQSLIIGILAIVAGIGPALVIIGTLVSAIGTIGGALGAVAGVISGPILLAIGLVVGAIALLYLAWTNNWGGIQEKAAAVWAFLQTIWAQLVTWLQTNIPLAIKTLSDYWTTTLLPALQAVWGWMSTVLFPFLQSLANVYLAAVGYQVKVLAELWRSQLQPALEKVWGFIEKYIIPILIKLTEFVFPVKVAFEGLGKVLGKVTEWLNKVAEAINSLELPDWLTPGSPTPFEMGLRGIGGALRDLSASDLPGLKAALQVQPVMGSLGAGGLAGGLGGGGGIVVHQEFYGPADPAQVKKATKDGVLAAARARGVR